MSRHRHVRHMVSEWDDDGAGDSYESSSYEYGSSYGDGNGNGTHNGGSGSYPDGSSFGSPGAAAFRYDAAKRSEGLSFDFGAALSANETNTNAGNAANAGKNTANNDPHLAVLDPAQDEDFDVLVYKLPELMAALETALGGPGSGGQGEGGDVNLELAREAVEALRQSGYSLDGALGAMLDAVSRRQEMEQFAEDGFALEMDEGDAPPGLRAPAASTSSPAGNNPNNAASLSRSSGGGGGGVIVLGGSSGSATAPQKSVTLDLGSSGAPSSSGGARAASSGLDKSSGGGGNSGVDAGKGRAALKESSGGMMSSSSSSRDVKNSKQMSAARRKEVEGWVQERHRGNGKPDLHLVVIGHVDAGKSTLMGHVLFRLGVVDDRSMHKFRKESDQMGKGSFAFAWVLDANEDERERGVTMDVSVGFFETAHRRITLLDAPGHRDFVPNMITGTSQADAAILVVDAAAGGFESGFRDDGQTKEHALLARALGVTQLVVAVNKLDAAEWSRDRFELIKEELGSFLKGAGFRPSQVRWIPVSGLTGVNLVTPPADDDGHGGGRLLEWWNPDADKKAIPHAGETLEMMIDSFEPPQREIEKPLRLVVSDVYKGSHFGNVVIAGKLECGILSKGDHLLMLPSKEHATVKGIRCHGASAEFAIAGDNVDVSLGGIELGSIHMGDIFCDPEHPMPLAKSFSARILCFELTRPIVKGQQAEFHMQNTSEPCIVTHLRQLLDRATGEVKKKRPRSLASNATALVEIKMSRRICIETFAENKQLGRFTLRVGGRTVGAGIVTEIKKE